MAGLPDPVTKPIFAVLHDVSKPGANWPIDRTNALGKTGNNSRVILVTSAQKEPLTLTNANLAADAPLSHFRLICISELL